MTVINNAVYAHGERIATPARLTDTYGVLSQSGPGALAWIGLFQPSDAELDSIAKEFDLHPLAVEDAVKAHQRPKVERYGNTLFVVLRSAYYDDALEKVEFNEFHVFVGANFVISVRHGKTPHGLHVRERLENDPTLLKLGPEAVLYALLDEIVDSYGPVVAGLENDIDEIEDQVFDGEPSVSQRIYELSREVIAFQRATKPLHSELTELFEGFDKYGVDIEMQRYLRDVQDHLLRVIEQLDSFRQLLQAVLTTNSTLVAQRQNDEMEAMTRASLQQNDEVKKISSWAAILIFPTLIAGIYGMNFEHMPELGWFWGYPMAIGIMVLGSGALYVSFKRREWL